MLHKILIANRGEIAARIIRTCKKMGIQTVVVYSEADATAPFVSQADEAYLLGAARVDESYMNMDKIFEIAAKAKVDAIHPGYGFFSEHAGFAATCRDKGFVFIGPSAAIIEKWAIRYKQESSCSLLGYQLYQVRKRRLQVRKKPFPMQSKLATL